MKNLLGSNQYKTRKGYFTPQPAWKLTRVNWKDFSVLAAVSFIVTIIAVEHHVDLARNHVNDSMSWVKKAKAEEIQTYQTPQLAPMTERQAMIRIIKKIWGSDWQTGLAISSCESGIDGHRAPNGNTNGTLDVGLFRVNTVHGWTVEEMSDPIANAGYAYSIFKDQGLAPWESSKHCWINRIDNSTWVREVTE